MTRGALLIAAALFVGCSPCEEVCRVEARQFEDCLDDWGMDWIDVGALEKPDYRRSCVDETGVWLDSLEPSARTAEGQQCQSLLSQLSGTTDCDAAWDALVAY